MNKKYPIRGFQSHSWLYFCVIQVKHTKNKTRTRKQGKQKDEFSSAAHKEQKEKHAISDKNA